MSASRVVRSSCHRDSAAASPNERRSRLTVDWGAPYGRIEGAHFAPSAADVRDREVANRLDEAFGGGRLAAPAVSPRYGLPSPQAKPDDDPPETPLIRAFQRYPQRDSNPCRHLARDSRRGRSERQRTRRAKSWSSTDTATVDGGCDSVRSRDFRGIEGWSSLIAPSLSQIALLDTVSVPSSAR